MRGDQEEPKLMICPACHLVYTNERKAGLYCMNQHYMCGSCQQQSKKIRPDCAECRIKAIKDPCKSRIVPLYNQLIDERTKQQDEILQMTGNIGSLQARLRQMEDQFLQLQKENAKKEAQIIRLRQETATQAQIILHQEQVNIELKTKVQEIQYRRKSWTKVLFVIEGSAVYLTQGLTTLIRKLLNTKKFIITIILYADYSIEPFMHQISAINQYEKISRKFSSVDNNYSAFDSCLNLILQTKDLFDIIYFFPVRPIIKDESRSQVLGSNYQRKMQQSTEEMIKKLREAYINKVVRIFKRKACSISKHFYSEFETYNTIGQIFETSDLKKNVKRDFQIQL